MSQEAEFPTRSSGKRIASRRLLIACASAASALACLLPAQSIAYWRGYYQGVLQTPPRYLFFDAFLAIMCGTLWLIGVGFAVAAGVEAIRSGQRLSVTRVALAVVLLVAVPLTFYVRGPATLHHVEGFRDGMKKLPVNYDAIRSWRARLQLPPGEVVPSELWSKEIRMLRPQFVHTEPRGAVTIVYGSGFGHWGITVHASRDEPPRQYNVAPGVDAWFSE